MTIKDWIAIIMRVTGNESRIVMGDLIFKGMTVFVWVFLVIFTTLQATVNPMWLWRSSKKLGCALALGFACGLTGSCFACYSQTLVDRRGRHHLCLFHE